MPAHTELPLRWTGLDIAAYFRISSDRAGRGLGVARQREDVMALLTGREVDPAGVAEYAADNDRSATRGDRPDFNRLVQAVRGGEVQVIATWSVDRLTRNPDEASTLIQLAKATPLRAIATTREGVMDLATPDGVRRFRDLATSAEFETGQKQNRQHAERRQSAKRGAWNGGHRPFGYQIEAARLEIDPAEAALVAEAARRVLAGETVTSVVKDFAVRGVVGPRGKVLSPVTLRQILTSPLISGRRKHHDEIVCDNAQWPAIISAADSDRLRTLLKRPATRAKRKKHLLSKLLVCGMCGYGLVGVAARNHYRCPPRTATGGGGCGRISVRMTHTDVFIGAVVVRALSSQAVWDRLHSSDDAEIDAAFAELRTIDDDLTALADDLGRGEISRSEWQVARGGLTARQKALRSKLETSQSHRALVALGGLSGPVEDRYAALNADQRRAIIDAVIESVVVAPRGGSSFEERFTFTWRA